MVQTAINETVFGFNVLYELIKASFNKIISVLKILEDMIRVLKVQEELLILVYIIPPRKSMMLDWKQVLLYIIR